MPENDKQLQALRKAYRKNLLANLGAAALSVVMAVLLLNSPVFTPSARLPWAVAAGLAVVLAAVEYAVERSLYKKGKRVRFLLTGFVLAALLLYFSLCEAGLLGAEASLFYPLFLGFLLIRPLIPAVGLLRDGGRLREGDLCETVGRMKKDTRRKEASVGSEAYLLFEDELTHEVHLLRMGSVSPLHRYRVFYLPHSGLAAGEVIPDNITFDPFGNPVERKVAEAEQPTEKPDYTEESYAAKPDYKEDEPAEKPWYQNPEAFSSNPPKEEPRVADTAPDPGSPERQRAAKYRIASKVCRILTFVFIGVMFFGGITTQSPAIIFPSFLFIIPSILLSGVFKDKELKLRCTMRTTAFCIDTVRRRSGKSSTRHPIVEYEVKGVTHTAELSISCSRDAVGDLYTICYDPLDPDTVRPERRGLFD